MFGKTWHSSLKHLQRYADDCIQITLAISKLDFQSLNPSSIQRVILYSAISLHILSVALQVTVFGPTSTELPRLMAMCTALAAVAVPGAKGLL